MTTKEQKRLRHNERSRKWANSPKGKAYMKAYYQRPEVKAFKKAYQKAYRQTEKSSAYQKAYKKSDEYKAYQKAYRKEMREETNVLFSKIVKDRIDKLKNSARRKVIL